MSPSRRLLLQVLALVVAALVVAGLLVRGGGGKEVQSASQSDLGPVLLVPGYGGATAALETLAVTLRAAGRTAVVVRLPNEGNGDLRESATVLDAAATAAGGPSVDLLGYSAGGVIARIWAADHPERVRRVVTLGSPHHGTRVAAAAAALAPGACPPACQQLVPGSALLDELNEGDETPDGPQWMAVWTKQDETVTPPESARLDGAVNVALQDVCPSVNVPHGGLPTSALVRGLVLQALSTDDIDKPSSSDCQELSQG